MSGWHLNFDAEAGKLDVAVGDTSSPSASALLACHKDNNALRGEVARLTSLLTDCQRHQ
eukprot:gene5427-5438_t